MAIGPKSLQIVLMWDGRIHSGHPDGWLEGTGLGVAEVRENTPSGRQLRKASETLYRFAKQRNWTLERAQAEFIRLHQMHVRGVLPLSMVELEFFAMFQSRREEEVGSKIVVPELLLPLALIESVGRTDDGELIRAIAIPWTLLLDELLRDPDYLLKIPPRQLEELIAAAYDQAGYRVELTPRSGDHGRDVIATLDGHLSVRLYDQVKAYKPGHVVTAAEVRELLGAISVPNVTKGVMTTTSTFAPELLKDPAIRSNVPYRIELRDKATLLPWLEMQRKNPATTRAGTR